MPPARPSSPACGPARHSAPRLGEIFIRSVYFEYFILMYFVIYFHAFVVLYFFVCFPRLGEIYICFFSLSSVFFKYISFFFLMFFLFSFKQSFCANWFSVLLFSRTALFCDRRSVQRWSAGLQCLRCVRDLPCIYIYI